MADVYDRDSELQSRLNAFLADDLGLPSVDYYSRLDLAGFLKMKSVLSDINNILTLKVSLAFAQRASSLLGLDRDTTRRIESQVLATKPNANGYDIELSDPVKIIAEIKCNIPINGGRVYGSAQKDGIAKDIDALVNGKSKSPMQPDDCLKFMVFLDTPEVRAASEHFVKNMKVHKERVCFTDNEKTIRSLDRVYVVFVTF